MPRKRNEMVPGGTRDRIANLLRDETGRCGHALRMRELRDRLPEDLARKGVDMGHVLNKLVQRGVVIVVSGRRSKRQYRHRDHAVPAAPNEDIALEIYWVLRDLVASHGRPMTTREVSAACRAKNIRRTAAGYHPYLMSLSRASHVHAEGASAAPMVERFPKQTLAGQMTYLWAPVGAVFADNSWRDSTVPPLHTANERLRRAVAAVERETGRPVRRRDVFWWWRANKLVDPVAAGFDMVKLASRFQILTEQPAKRGRIKKVNGSTTTWRLVRHRTAFTGAGAAAAWFHVPGLNEEGLATALLSCALEDACSFYRIGDEVESLRLLEVNAGGVGSQAEAALLIHMVRVRRDMLFRVVREAVGSDSTRDGAVVAACEHAVEVRDLWRERLRETAEFRRKNDVLPAGVHHLAREQADLRRALAESRMLLGLSGAEETQGREAPPLQPGYAKAVGEAAITMASEVYPLALSAAEHTGVPAEKGARNILSPVRRMPGGGSMAVGPRFERRAVYENIELDRVEAVLACVDAVGASRTSAVVAPARTLLGHVFRDVDVLERLLRKDEDKGSRRNLMVALSLMGRTPLPEDLVRSGDAWEEADVAAIIVATSLAHPSDALDALEALRESLQDAHSDMFEEAVTRCSAGNLLSLVG